MQIAVLGLATQSINRKDSLPILDSNKGRTKNGHSIILKLTIGNLRLLLGGDLNSSSEEYLLKCFTNKDISELKKKILDHRLVKLI